MSSTNEVKCQDQQVIISSHQEPAPAEDSADEEESEVWKVVCQTGLYEEDGTLEGLYPKNYYTFDNFKDAKNEFDSIVKAEEADARYAEIALWTSKNEDEELEVWYYEKDDKMPRCSGDDAGADEEDQDDDEGKCEDCYSSCSNLLTNEQKKIIDEHIARVRERDALTNAQLKELDTNHRGIQFYGIPELKFSK